MFQMISHQFFRSIHTNYILCYSTKKTLLSKLRKKTGYAFVNCKKALELHNNDIEKVKYLTNYNRNIVNFFKYYRLKNG